MFAAGLPRSGSTVLMNILNENPTIYTTGTCPLTYIFEGIKKACTSVSEFVAMDMDVLDKSMDGFLRQGINGWFEAQTKKPNIISKSRCWDMHYRHLFKLYKNPKIIYILRDPRDIIVSFEKLLAKYPNISMGSNDFPFEWNNFDKRIELYCTDISANLGRPLMMLDHSCEYMDKYPNNFFIFKWENFIKNPISLLNLLYDWMELPNFNHNLDCIPPSDYYEHDPVYRSLVSHKTKSKFEPIPPQWPQHLTKDQSSTILRNLKSFYLRFYPEMLHNEFR